MQNLYGGLFKQIEKPQSIHPPSVPVDLSQYDDEYITYIYCYNHTLCELIASKNSVFTLSGGQEIIPVQQFMPTFISDSLVHIAITDTNGDVLDLYLPIHGNSRKEDS